MYNNGVFYFAKLSKVHDFIGNQFKVNRDFLMQPTSFFFLCLISVNSRDITLNRSALLADLVIMDLLIYG